MDWLKTFKRKFLTVSALVFLVLPASLEAAWLPDPTLNTRITEFGGSQADPVTVSDGAGGAYIIWVSTATDIVLAQRVSSAGIPLWPQNGILVAGSAKEQRYPEAISDGAGGVIVTWYDGDADATFDVFAQRISPSGALLWGPNGAPISTGVGGQSWPILVSDGASGAIIAWRDTRAGTSNFDIYAQRVNSSGTPLWTANGVPLCTATANQTSPAIGTDAAGGAIVAWTDHRNVVADIYAQRVSAAGVPLWAPNGVAISTAPGIQQYPVVVRDYPTGAFVAWMDLRNDGGDVFAQRVDGSGVAQWASNGVAVCWAVGVQSGVSMISNSGSPILTWTDERNGSTNKDIFAQRLSSTGTPLWAANGVAVCTASGNQMSAGGQKPHLNIIEDGSSGVIVAWDDFRNGSSSDLYAQRLNSGGAPQWAANGVAVSTASSGQGGPVPVTDGANGAIIAWEDGRSYEIYAQLVRSTGELGSPPPPVILRISDVPNDQGGKVQIEWGASSMDYDPSFAIANYTVWRRVPNAPDAAGAAPAASGTEPVSLSGRTRIQTAGAGGQALYWEYLATLPARGFPGYSYVAETTSDSLGASNPYTSFMILAEEPGGVPFYASAADSGYSVDNLSPASPWPVGGQYLAGSVRIHWAPNTEDDVAGYRVYKGSSADFETGSSCLLASSADTTCVDGGPAGSYYKLTAFDVHGNESPATLLSPAQISAAETAESPGQIRFAAPWPNPSGGSVAFRVTLPRDSDVRVTVFDVLGRTVKQVAAQRTPAGHHVYRWDGRQAQGAECAAGVYFARLDVDGKPQGTRRITIIR